MVLNSHYKVHILMDKLSHVTPTEPTIYPLLFKCGPKSAMLIPTLFFTGKCCCIDLVDLGGNSHFLTNCGNRHEFVHMDFKNKISYTCISQ